MLQGKKLACFIALQHHTRFLLPVTQAALRKGANVKYFVTTSDYPFERILVKNNYQYSYLADYMTPEVKDKISRSNEQFLQQWKDKLQEWLGFNLWPLLIQERAIKQTIEEYFCIEQFILTEKPDVFVALHERNRWGKLIGHLAHKHGIPLVTLQEGDYHETRLSFTAHTEYSMCNLLWGDDTKRQLINHLAPAEKLVTVGNTHLDNTIKQLNNPKRINEIKKKYDVHPDRKVVLVFVDLDWAAVMNKDAWQKVVGDLSHDVSVIFKWHPNIAAGTYATIEERVRELHPNLMITHSADPYELVAISDYCVTMGKTTLALEACAFGKPLFSICSRDTEQNYYADKGVSQPIKIGDWSPLHKTIEEGEPESVCEGKEQYLRDSFYKIDGKASARALEVIDFLISESDPRARNKSVKIKFVRNELIDNRISVILPTGDDVEALMASLTSLSDNFKYDDWELILVKSSNVMDDVLESLGGDVVIVEDELSLSSDNVEGGNSVSSGLARLYNKGAAHATGKVLMFMRPGLFYVKTEDLIGKVANSVYGVNINTTDMQPYCHGIYFDFNFAPKFRTNDEETPQVIGGGLLAVEAVNFVNLGGFDENLLNHLVEVDFCLAARFRGIRVIKDEDAVFAIYRDSFYGLDCQSDEWKRGLTFYARWMKSIIKDDNYALYAEPYLKVS